MRVGFVVLAIALDGCAGETTREGSTSGPRIGSAVGGAGGGFSDPVPEGAGGTDAPPDEAGGHAGGGSDSGGAGAEASGGGSATGGGGIGGGGFGGPSGGANAGMGGQAGVASGGQGAVDSPFGTVACGVTTIAGNAGSTPAAACPQLHFAPEGATVAVPFPFSRPGIVALANGAVLLYGWQDDVGKLGLNTRLAYTVVSPWNQWAGSVDPPTIVDTPVGADAIVARGASDGFAVLYGNDPWAKSPGPGVWVSASQSTSSTALSSVLVDVAPNARPVFLAGGNGGLLAGWSLVMAPSTLLFLGWTGASACIAGPAVCAGGAVHAAAVASGGSFLFVVAGSASPSDCGTTAELAPLRLRSHLVTDGAIAVADELDLGGAIVDLTLYPRSVGGAWAVWTEEVSGGAPIMRVARLDAGGKFFPIDLTSTDGVAVPIADGLTIESSFLTWQFGQPGVVTIVDRLGDNGILDGPGDWIDGPTVGSPDGMSFLQAVGDANGQSVFLTRFDCVP